MAFLEKILEIFTQSGYAAISRGNVGMLIIAAILLYLAIVKKFEPLLLLPIAFGAILVNLPLSGIMQEHGFLHYLAFGTRHEIFPILIFMGVGAMTDFGPIIANPKTLILGAGAQFGVFFTFFVALAVGFTMSEAASIGIIGGADGPTSIYLANRLAPDLLGSIAVAAYTYMALVCVVFPGMCLLHVHHYICEGQ